MIFPTDVLHNSPCPHLKSFQSVSLVISQCPSFRSIKCDVVLNDSLYDLLLQILLVIFERSSLLLLNAFLAIAILLLITKLVHLLYYLSIYCNVDRVDSFSFTAVSGDSHHFHVILHPDLAQRLHYCLQSILRLCHHSLIFGKLHIL